MTRSSAPDAVLVFRTVGAVALIVAYGVFRLPFMSSPVEFAATWTGAVVLTFVFERSIVELHYRRGARIALREADTTTFAVPMRWPDEVELAIAGSRHEHWESVIRDGEIVEPALFTHEYNPASTPPHGIPALQLDNDADGYGRHAMAAELARRHIAGMVGGV